jgi:hypothetical protein
MLETYCVQWEIEVDACSAEDAARQALEIHRDRHSLATEFSVVSEDGEVTRVDLTQIDQAEADT